MSLFLCKVSSVLHCLYLLLYVLATLLALCGLQEDGHCQTSTFGSLSMTLGMRDEDQLRVSKGTRGKGVSGLAIRVSWFGKEKEISVVSGNKGMELNSSHIKFT